MKINDRPESVKVRVDIRDTMNLKGSEELTVRQIGVMFPEDATAWIAKMKESIDLGGGIWMAAHNSPDGSEVFYISFSGSSEDLDMFEKHNIFGIIADAEGLRKIIKALQLIESGM